MTRFLVAAFLIAHGLLHLAIWATPTTPDRPGPFDPRHSWAFGGAAAATTARSGSVVLACAVAAAYSTAGGMVAISSSAWAVLAGLAALVGLALKGLWFHPWLSLGVVLDIAVIAAAVLGWPAAL